MIKSSTKKSPEKLQEIVQTIHKLATPFSGSFTQAPSAPSSDKWTEVSHPTTPSSAPISNISHPSVGGGSNPVIRKMQEAIVELASKVKGSALPVNAPGNLLESLTNIDGTNFADGAWGPITDAALHHVLDFAKYLLALANKFKIDIRSVYPANNLDSFGKLLSGYEVGPHSISLSLTGNDTDAGQVERAPIITQHIAAISELYSQILSKLPNVSNENLLNHTERQYLQTGSVLIHLDGQPRVVPLSALKSIRDYNNFITSHKLDASKMEILDAVINNANSGVS